MAVTGWALWWRLNVFPVRYELGSYVPEDGILNSHRLENLKCYKFRLLSFVACKDKERL
jgi:hypothetical protein